MPTDAQSNNLGVAVPGTKYGMAILIAVMWAVCIISGFVAANYF
jgi:hypothetical protein